MDHRPEQTAEDACPRLPPELIHLIMAELDRAGQHATLAVVMRVSMDLYDHIAPLIYRKVIVTHDNAKSVYLGLPTATSRRRRAREKVDRGITWAEFRHPNHYLDWAAGNDWGHNENLRQKTLYLDWPVGEIDSDDSDCDTTEDTVPYAYPTQASSFRKRRLLSLVKCLHIQEVPSRHLSLALKQLIESHYLRELVPSILAGTRSALETLSICPKAVWKVVDYHDRHKRVHPFLDFLSSLSPPHICIQLPIIDRHLEKAYMSSRIVPLDEHHSRSSNVDQFTYLRSRLRDLLRPAISNRSTFGAHLHPYFSALGTRSITIHNQVPIARPPVTDSFRVFHRPCACRDPSISDPVDDDFCYNHFEPTTLLTRVVTGLHAEQGRVEFIDLDWVSGSEHAARDAAIMEHTVGAIETVVGRQKNPLADDSAFARRSSAMDKERGVDEKVTASTAAETEECICCGHRQLDGAKVSRHSIDLFAMY